MARKAKLTLSVWLKKEISKDEGSRTGPKMFTSPRSLTKRYKSYTYKAGQNAARKAIPNSSLEITWTWFLAGNSRCDWKSDGDFGADVARGIDAKC